MKKQKLLSLFSLFSFCVTPVFAQLKTSAEVISNSTRVEFLQNAVVGTPYSALIIHSKVEITPLPASHSTKAKSAADEKTGEERHTYHARVLETFKGKAFRTIRYEMIVETGELAELDSKPQLLTLCKGPRGFYWPGVGASFPADPELIAAARNASKQSSKSVLKAKSQCE
jgi:hypothetical protein